MKIFLAFLGGLVLASLVVAGLSLSVSLHPQQGGPGAAINYTNSQSNVNLYNEVAGIFQDLAALRQYVGYANQTTSAALQLPATPTGAAAGSWGATSSVTVAGVANGDFVFVTFASSTVAGTPLNNKAYNCSAQGSATNTVLLACNGNSTTSISAFGTDATWLIFPKATYTVPPALVTTSSTAS